MKKIDKAVNRSGGLERGLAFELPTFAERSRIDPTLAEERWPDEAPEGIDGVDPADNIPVDPLDLLPEADADATIVNPSLAGGAEPESGETRGIDETRGISDDSEHEIVRGDEQDIVESVADDMILPPEAVEYPPPEPMHKALFADEPPAPETIPNVGADTAHQIQQEPQQQPQQEPQQQPQQVAHAPAPESPEPDDIPTLDERPHDEQPELVLAADVPEFEAALAAPELPASAGTSVAVSSLAAMPVSRKTLAEHHICVLDDHAAGAAFRMARTQLLQRMDENGWRSLAVVSASSGDGKSVVAMNLALAIAEDSNHTALLVDLDLRHPVLHTFTGQLMSYGLDSYFEGVNDIEDILVRIHTPRLAFLPCCAPVPRSAEVLSSAAGKSLLDDLSSRYDDRIVIVDLPPILEYDDTLAVLPNVDAVLLVVGEGNTRKSDLAEVRRLLRDKPIAGVLLNQSRAAA